MGITLAQLVAERAEVTVPVGEDAVSVVYRPGRVTAEFAARLDTSSGDLQAFRDACEAIAEIIESWDLEEDGAPYPATGEAIAALPIPFVGRIVRAIVEDVGPGEANGGSSSSRPARRAGSGASRHGSR